MAAKLALARPASLDPSKTPSYNPKMEYRRLGKTGMHVSAVCMGGHWKRVATMLGSGFKGEGYAQADNLNVNNPAFLKNRDEVITRCLEVGINYIDACAGPEVMAYSKVLKGRRDKIYFGYSWSVRESRFGPYRAAQALIKGLEDGLRESGLDAEDIPTIREGWLLAWRACPAQTQTIWPDCSSAWYVSSSTEEPPPDMELTAYGLYVIARE